MIRIAAASLLVLALCLAAPRTAHAAQSYDNCSGFITSIPAVITTQGTWCLKQDLTTAMTGGAGITVNTNNVTIDCNDFKLGGLAGGTATTAMGIFALDRVNLTVRHCNIRGFQFGLYFLGSGGGGHLIEDNRFDSCTYEGILVQGDGSVVQRNRVFDTGGTSVYTTPIGIEANGSIDVMDNTVAGLAAVTGSNGGVWGISTSNNADGQISGNRVRGLVRDGTGLANGIYNASSGRITLRNNNLVGDGNTNGRGLRCTTGGAAITKDNAVNHFDIGNQDCNDNGGNTFTP